MIHSGKTQAQIARELGVSEYSLTLWKRDYLGHVRAAQLEGQQLSPEQMLEKIRRDIVKSCVSGTGTSSLN